MRSLEDRLVAKGTVRVRHPWIGCPLRRAVLVHMNMFLERVPVVHLEAVIAPVLALAMDQKLVEVMG